MHLQKFPFGEDEFFEALKQEIIRGSVENNEVDLLNMSALSQVCSDIAEILPEARVGITLHPAFKAGSASFKTSTAWFSGDEVEQLCSALSKCSAFEVSPLANGNMDISFTVKGVYK